MRQIHRNAAACVTLLTMAAAVGIDAAGAESASRPDSTVINLSNVEVTANRAGSRTPVAFTNISGSEIDAVNDGRDLPFIIQSTPSIVVTGDAGGGIGYSGIRVRGSDPSRINVTANGVPINDSESSRVYWVNMPDLTSSLRDIQIQRGAGTSTNGAGAFGASINMITDAPSLDPSAEVVSSYGSYNTNRQTIKVATGTFADTWSVDARISHIGSDGYIDRASSRLWSYMGQLAYMASRLQVRLLAFGGKERTYMAWDYASKEEMAKYGRRYNPCGKYTTAEGTTAFYPDQYDNFAQHHLQLHSSYLLSPSTRLNAVAHYTMGDGYYEQYKTRRSLVEYGLTPFVDSEGNKVKKSDLIRRKFNDNDFGGAMVNINHTGESLNAIVGSAINRHRGNHFGQIIWVRNYVGPINPLQEYYRNQGCKLDANIFGRADWSINSRLTAYADLQLRHINYSIRGISDNFDPTANAPASLDIARNYNFFNPKAGLTFTDGPHRAYASWSVAHKEPVRDNFTDASPGHYPTPERLFDYEVGWAYDTQLLNISTGFYFMDYRDQLVLTGELSDTGNPVSTNVARSYRAGIELQATLRPASWFDWSVNATLSRNRIKDFTEIIYEDEWTNPIAINHGNTPIAFSPAVIANNAFTVKLGQLSASLATRYVSEQYMNNAASPEAKLDSYCVSDLGAAYTITALTGVKSLRLGITVYNLFNTLYCNNGYAAAGYTVNPDVDGGRPQIYRYAGFAAQAPINAIATIAMTF